MYGSILPKKYLVVRRTTRPQLLVVEHTRTIEFCYPVISCCFNCSYLLVFGKIIREAVGPVDLHSLSGLDFAKIDS